MAKKPKKENLVDQNPTTVIADKATDKAELGVIILPNGGILIPGEPMPPTDYNHYWC